MSPFRAVNRGVDFLLPPLVQEWLPEGHLARDVVEVVAGLDLREGTGLRRARQSALPSGHLAVAADLRLRHRLFFQPQGRAGDLRLLGVSLHRGEQSSRSRHLLALTLIHRRSPELFHKAFRSLSRVNDTGERIGAGERARAMAGGETSLRVRRARRYRRDEGRSR